MKHLTVFLLLLLTFATNTLAQNSTGELQTQELRHTKEILEQKTEAQNKEIAHQREVMKTHLANQNTLLKEYDKRTANMQWFFGVFVGILTVIVAGVGIFAGFTFFNAQRRIEEIRTKANDLEADFENRIEKLKDATDNLHETISQKVEARLIEREEEQMVIDALYDEERNSSLQIKELKKKFAELRKKKDEKDYLAFDWFMLGNEEYDKGETDNYGKACEYFEKATTINPVFAAAYNNWGNALSNLGKQEEAIQKYEKAIQINPSDASAYNNWGNALNKLGKQEEAIQKYKKTIEIKPNYAEAYYNWGNALDNLGKLEEAIEKYEKAIQINPNHASAYNNWGNALSNLGKLEEAIEKYKKAIEINPNHASAYHNWNISLNSLKRKDKKLYTEKVKEFQALLQQHKNLHGLKDNEKFMTVYEKHFPKKEKE